MITFSVIIWLKDKLIKHFVVAIIWLECSMNIVMTDWLNDDSLTVIIWLDDNIDVIVTWYHPAE
jgi:hypothetical protein